MKKLWILLLLTGLPAFTLMAQEAAPNYQDKKGLGDKVFNLDIGVDVPLFFQEVSGATHPTNLSVGGILGLGMEGYLNNDFRLGGGFKLNFASNPNAKYLFALPFFATGTYEYRFYPFRVNGNLAVGGILQSYGEEVRVDPFLAPGFNFSYLFDPKWAVGLNTRYWWVPQLYFSDTIPFEQSRLGNFLEVTLNFAYYFY